MKFDKVLKYKVFLDMDGVLVDFPTDKVMAMSREEQAKNVWHNAQFWVDLPLRDGAIELYNFVKENFASVSILSSPSRNSNTEVKKGKKLWIAKHIGKINTILDTDKYKYAKENYILIDDHSKFLDPWIKAGGIGIKHRNTEDTIKQIIKEIG